MRFANSTRTISSRAELAYDNPSRQQLEQVFDRVKKLGFKEEDLAPELAPLRGCLDALDIQDRIGMGMLPIISERVDGLSPNDACHFAAPVRFGRRLADQFGHLLFTSSWIRFRGAMDMSITWTEVCDVQRDRREIVVSLLQSRRTLRFWCHTYSEAAVGVIIGEHRVHTHTGSPGPSRSVSVLRAAV